MSLFAQVIAKHGPSLTPAALEAMSYADAVIREVLRITPPSASVFRKATVDLEVRDSQGFLSDAWSAHSMLACGQHSMHGTALIH